MEEREMSGSGEERRRRGRRLQGFGRACPFLDDGVRRAVCVFVLSRLHSGNSATDPNARCRDCRHLPIRSDFPWQLSVRASSAATLTDDFPFLSYSRRRRVRLRSNVQELDAEPHH